MPFKKSYIGCTSLEIIFTRLKDRIETVKSAAPPAGSAAGAGKSGSKNAFLESEMYKPESEMYKPESEMYKPEAKTDFFICGLVLYSSIAYGLLLDGVVCSGLPVEPAPNTLSAAFLMSAKRAEKAKKAEWEYI
ncbi:MAG: hypothetical protein LBD13_03350 [Spirochaetaceae bacterium]|jgi:hypothetical protein|nr:hypothetical protein [Spirochaetaceae bacterium]